ncbi:L-threonine 3-dehydrogenase [Limibaculum sp. M0105]|uniref:L-threonine 3-dehydrogenase n=1 Tax=Thermohalobaculum xanthum TaxID=2753746 RepID=A0A8J7S987_9RHOB|nr:L-threonine 3-dehydrogenase [Thermohalobaculum xanthum]MBK0397607.1 L-threonine 3-dehydrogenase [Thermohalobaculum xanthum]
MKALVKAEDAPGLVLRDVEKPVPGPGDVLIRVKRASICGTDMHIWKWDDWARKTVPVPMVVGHEYMGVVEANGPGANATIGARVSGEGHIPCGHCRNCLSGRAHICAQTKGIGVNRQGAFAEWVVIPEANLRPLPDSIPDEIAAILDPLGNAVHTALAFDLVGEDVLITGAGPIGCMAAAVCRHVGAHHVVVTDINDARLRLAEQMGATRGVRADREDLRDVMRALGMREGFDVGLEMSGAEAALDAMIGAMITGGKVALLGLFAKRPAIDLNTAIFKGLTFEGIYGRKMYETWHKMLAMLESGLDVSPVISHRLAFEDFAQGFEAVSRGEANKVVLEVA